MTTNSGHKALQEYCAAIQRIVSCVSNEVCYCFPNENGRQVLAWSAKGFIAIKCTTGKKLFIDINQEVEDPIPENKTKVSTKFYLYSIADPEEVDLIGFHYHPELTEDPILYPHVHAYAKDDDRFTALNLHRRHIPSGRVALEDVIRWLIVELNAVPLRQDWDQILTDAKDQFTKTRTWS